MQNSSAQCGRGEQHLWGGGRTIPAFSPYLFLLLMDVLTEDVVRPCEENERGAHIEQNVRCGHTGEKKKRTTKPTMERCMQERHDRGGPERGRHDKQGSMED